MNKEKQNKIFEKEFARLNDAQKAAVKLIEGPVMVAAGPGTGKTQVVALRIAEILRQTQLNGSNILALTFTDAGVSALRSRLESIIGPLAYQVTISTFHSFAKSIVDTFPYLFSHTDSLDQISEAEQYTILSKIISDMHSLKYLRPIRSPQWHVSAISGALKTLKREDITSEKLRKFAKTLEKDSKETTKAKIEKASREVGILNELALILDEYQKYLKEQGLYDYDDVILFAIEALKKFPDVKSYYQERYQYILADEYQDTNNAQNELVMAIADYFSNPNLFVVGDDKQAIYRFQGASVANMLFFKKKYSEMKIITLKENYRSHSAILNIANELIQNNKHQLNNYEKDIDTDIYSQKLQTGEVKLIAAPTILTQYCWIIKKVNNLIKNNVEPDEIAVLFRTNKEIEEFTQLALKSGLPIAGVAKVDVLTKPKIQQIIIMLRAISKPFNNEYVFPVLRLINSNISLLTIMKLSQAFKWGKSLAKDIDDVKDDADYDLDEVKIAIEKILGWRKYSEESTVSELIETIMTESDYLKTIKERPDELEQLSEISSFLGEAKRFSIRKSKNNLDDFIKYIDDISAYGLSLSIDQIKPTSDGVKLSTVHGVKGLEYKAVFLTNVSDDNWGSEKKRGLIELPGSLIGLKDWQEDTIEEERRLFYVAITRAKDYLYLTYSKTKDSGKPTLPCLFVSEVKDQLPSEEINMTEDEAKKIWTTSIKAPTRNQLKETELRYIREIISTQPLSYTAFKTYQLCPHQYLLYHVLRYPQKGSTVLAYGSAIHKTLENYFRIYKASRKLPPKEKLSELLTESIRKQSEISTEERLIFYNSGKEILDKYYEKFNESWTIPIDLEYKFKNHFVKVNDVWVTGNYDRIDLLDPLAKTVRVVDYKTGRTSKTRGQIEGTTQDSDGETKRQLVFYAMLAKNSKSFPYTAKEFTISYVDDSATFKQETFNITSSEITALEKEIADVYHQIMTTDEFVHQRPEYDWGCEICKILE